MTTKVSEIISQQLDDMKAIAAYKESNVYIEAIQKLPSHLAESAIEVYKYGGANTTDWKDAIAAATLTALTNGVKAIKFRKGIFYTSEALPIGIHISGAGETETIIECGVTNGYVLPISSYYTQPTRIENITIRNANIANDVGGLFVSNADAWGVCAILKNVSLLNFTTDTFYLRSVFNVYCENVYCYCGKRNNAYVNTFINIGGIDATHFSNQNSFKHCTFLGGKIGLKIKGAIGTSFDICTFQDLDLFLNTELITGISNTLFLKNCWFEQIRKGIINSKMDESTLTPILPIENKVSLALIICNNNIGATGLPAYFIDSTVEPTNYKYFDIAKGLNFEGSGSIIPTCGGTVDAGTFTYTSQEGSYERVGDLIFFTLKVVINTMTGATGRLFIGGLPFVCPKDTVVNVSLNGISWTGNNPVGIILAGFNRIDLYSLVTNAARTPIDVSLVANSDSINISGVYKLS